MQLHSADVARLHLHKLLLSSIGIGAIVALRLPQTRRWPRSVGVLFLAATVVSCAVQGMITGDAVTPAPLYMMLAIGTAAMLP